VTFKTPDLSSDTTSCSPDKRVTFRYSIFRQWLSQRCILYGNSNKSSRQSFLPVLVETQIVVLNVAHYSLWLLVNDRQLLPSERCATFTSLLTFCHRLTVSSDSLTVRWVVVLDGATRRENCGWCCLSTAVQEPPEEQKVLINTLWSGIHECVLVLFSVLTVHSNKQISVTISTEFIFILF
jgi:hypothetical protein